MLNLRMRHNSSQCAKIAKPFTFSLNQISENDKNMKANKFHQFKNGQLEIKSILRFAEKFNSESSWQNCSSEIYRKSWLYLLLIKFHSR